jgi:4a-hydroxytetrahydrobiopterin dehydratase
MADRLKASEFHRRADLPDWRVLLGRIEARFQAGSFDRAASFVQQIAALAETADHHPDVDLRYPGLVQVALVTHAARGLTDADVDLARAISAQAASDGIMAEALAPLRVEVAIDALDIDAIRPFWKAVLAYEDEAPPAVGDQVQALVDPSRIGPAIWFQQMDAPRPQRNRIHIDVIVPHDVAEARIAAALDAGGRLLTDEFARAFWVLADPEGNEACVCTWQDRD